MLLGSGNLTRFLCFVTFYLEAGAFPAKEADPFAIVPAKKDVFMSRSWGAGGMPYNAMEPNKGHRMRKLDLPRMEEKFETREENFPSLQYLTAPEGILHDIEPPRKHSVIPQLFVSYGWGPLGK